MDLALKVRFFRHLSSKDDPHAERLYRWHIIKRNGARFTAGVLTDGWKRNADDYVTSARGLFESMAVFGFDDTDPIPVDMNGELLGGAHRTACALALGLEAVAVEHRNEIAWAPPWGLRWFVENGMEFSDLKRTQTDFKALMELRP